MLGQCLKNGANKPLIAYRRVPALYLAQATPLPALLIAADHTREIVNDSTRVFFHDK